MALARPVNGSPEPVTPVAPIEELSLVKAATHAAATGVLQEAGEQVLVPDIPLGQPEVLFQPSLGSLEQFPGHDGGDSYSDLLLAGPVTYRQSRVLSWLARSFPPLPLVLPQDATVGLVAENAPQDAYVPALALLRGHNAQTVQAVRQPDYGQTLPSVTGRTPDALPWPRPHLPAGPFCQYGARHLGPHN